MIFYIFQSILYLILAVDITLESVILDKISSFLFDKKKHLLILTVEYLTTTWLGKDIITEQRGRYKCLARQCEKLIKVQMFCYEIQ